MTGPTAVLFCPGRGSYTSSELGWLKKCLDADLPGLDEVRKALARADEERNRSGQPTVTALDGDARFRPSAHLDGEIEEVRCARGPDRGRPIRGGDAQSSELLVQLAQRRPHVRDGVDVGAHSDERDVRLAPGALATSPRAWRPPRSGSPRPV